VEPAVGRLAAGCAQEYQIAWCAARLRARRAGTRFASSRCLSRAEPLSVTRRAARGLPRDQCNAADTARQHCLGSRSRPRAVSALAPYDYGGVGCRVVRVARDLRVMRSSTLMPARSRKRMSISSEKRARRLRRRSAIRKRSVPSSAPRSSPLP
jgi:hypothetical protein